MKKIFNMLALLLNDNTYKKRGSFIRTLLYHLSILLLYTIRSFPMFRRLLRKIYRRFLDWPKLLMIHPGQRCNLRCIYCYDEADRLEKKDTLNIEDYEDILDQAKKLGISQVQILGGEPLLYEHIQRLIDRCFSLDMDMVIYTNATLLDKNWIDHLLRYRSRITLLVSCDPPETYYETCGRDLFEKADTNIKKAIRAGLKLRFFIPVTKTNFRFIRKYAVERSDLNGLVPVFERYLPIKNNEIDKKLKLNKDQWNKIVLLSKRLQKKHKVIPIGEIVSCLRGTGCNDFYESIHISNTGEISPCDYLLGKYSFANIKESSLKEIWEIYKEKRDIWNKTPDECLNCKHLYRCNGGCKSWTFLTSCSFDKKDSLCDNVNPPFIY